MSSQEILARLQKALPTGADSPELAECRQIIARGNDDVDLLKHIYIRLHLAWLSFTHAIPARDSADAIARAEDILREHLRHLLGKEMKQLNEERMLAGAYRQAVMLYDSLCEVEPPRDQVAILQAGELRETLKTLCIFQNIDC